jgi:hypothetical protein
MNTIILLRKQVYGKFGVYTHTAYIECNPSTGLIYTYEYNSGGEVIEPMRTETLTAPSFEAVINEKINKGYTEIW